MGGHYIRWFEEIGIGDVASVGGKNASHQGATRLCRYC
jgi:phosphoenolpyruvate synthase/pyruvate phosphate dikinase